uniref:Uncharacterized protein n=1 Tax=Leersia perrieri TaxID=77586 RepID=A0A0D9XSL1_9ORYZ
MAANATAARRIGVLTRRAERFRERAKQLRSAEEELRALEIPEEEEELRAPAVEEEEELRARDVPEGRIPSEVARVLANIDMGIDMEENSFAYLRRWLKVLAGRDEQFVVGREGPPTEVQDFINSLEEDEEGKFEEKVRLNARQVDEVKEVWRHLNGVDHEDFRALDSACRGYTTVQRFGEPIGEANELLRIIRSSGWVSALETRANQLDAEAESLQATLT